MPEASEPKGERGVSTEAEIPDPSAIRPWPADQVERWPIERVIPYASNPRVHTEADLDKIAASIRKWGWTAPPVVDEAGVLIVGTARVAAAVKIGLATIPVIVARGWSEEEKNAYRIADNQLAARASWDPDLLRSELQELDFADFDLGLIGFEADALETILAGLGTSGFDRSGLRPGTARSTNHTPRRRVAVGPASSWLRRQHEHDRRRAGADGLAASTDGHRSALRRRL
jgi:ParB-like chromosome segregation protein Spo0J